MRISIYQLGPTLKKVGQQCDQDGHVQYNYFVQDHQDTENVLITRLMRLITTNPLNMATSPK
jgi:hypothetical protein